MKKFSRRSFLTAAAACGAAVALSACGGSSASSTAASSTAGSTAASAAAAAVVEADAVSAACKDKDKDNYPPAAVISEHEISPREI